MLVPCGLSLTLLRAPWLPLLALPLLPRHPALPVLVTCGLPLLGQSPSLGWPFSLGGLWHPGSQGMTAGENTVLRGGAARISPLCALHWELSKFLLSIARIFVLPGHKKTAFSVYSMRKYVKICEMES